MLLPTVKSSNAYTVKTTTFAGINYKEQIADGELSGARDVTNNAYPALSVDTKHLASTTFPQGDCRGLVSANGSLWAIITASSQTKLYKDGTVFGTTTFADSDKQMVIMGGYLVIFPDGIRINMQNATDVRHLNVGSLQSLTNVFMSPKEAVYLYTTGQTVQHPCEYISETEPSNVTANDYWLKTTYPDKKIHYDLYKRIANPDGTTKWESVTDTAIGIKYTNTDLLYRAEDIITLSCYLNTTPHTIVDNYKGVNLNGQFNVVASNETVIILKGTVPNDQDLVLNGSYGMHDMLWAADESITETGIDFTCGIQGTHFVKMTISTGATNPTVTYYDADDAATLVYQDGMWLREDVQSLLFYNSKVSKEFYDYIRRNSNYGTLTPNLQINRSIPEMDFVIERENRLWGCKYGVVNGENINMIYASKLGDPCNWYSFNSTAADSYYAQVGVGGAFTGAIQYGSYALFFKEDCIIRVYGQTPTAFGTQVIHCEGVKPGSSKSLVVLDGYLYYHAASGFMRYDNTYPTEISNALGTARFNAVVGAALKDKYVAIAALGTSATSTANYSMWIYDTRYKTWQQHAVGMACNGMCAHRLSTDEGEGEIYFSANAYGATHGIYHYGNVSNGYCTNWLATSGDLFMSTDEHKYCKKLVISCDVPVGSTMNIDVQYDGKGAWYRVATMQTPKERFNSCVIMPRRCGYLKLKFYGNGKAIVYSVSKYFDKGSTKCRLI